MEGLEEVLAQFGLGAARAVRRPELGKLHDVRLVQLAGGEVVVKVFDAAERAARDVGAGGRASAFVPVPERLSSSSGATTIEHGGRIWTVQRLAAGRQVDASTLRPEQAAGMGRTLATIHEHLDLADVSGPLAGPPPSADDALRRIDEVLAVIEAIETQVAGDVAAVEHLRARRAWVEQEGSTRDRRRSLDERTSLHGDFTLGNLFFEGDVVSAVIDWEMAQLGAAGSEVVRACHFSFADDAVLWSALLRGYRAVRPLSYGDLDEAAELHAVRRVRQLWEYEAVYLESNDRARDLTSSPAFIPWIDRWRAIRAQL